MPIRAAAIFNSSIFVSPFSLFRFPISKFHRGDS
jgi:hypothetical protein